MLTSSKKDVVIFYGNCNDKERPKHSIPPPPNQHIYNINIPDFPEMCLEK
jgi:hypothetical protein